MHFWFCRSDKIILICIHNFLYKLSDSLDDNSSCYIRGTAKAKFFHAVICDRRPDTLDIWLIVFIWKGGACIGLKQTVIFILLNISLLSLSSVSTDWLIHHMYAILASEPTIQAHNYTGVHCFLSLFSGDNMCIRLINCTECFIALWFLFEF